MIKNIYPINTLLKFNSKTRIPSPWIFGEKFEKFRASAKYIGVIFWSASLITIYGLLR
nr:MAG TPA: hypothetical protein [Caudoviricetes sp.]